MWSGTLSFGLIAIPIALTPAVRDADGRVSFHLLDARDGKRLRRRMYCPEHDKLVRNSEIVRGAEVAPGQYVTVDDDELRAAAPERSETLEITDFVPLDSIDPLYFDRPYWVTPQGGAKKPYRLLADVLEEERMAGIAEFVLNAREHVVALRALDGKLCLLLLHYADEIRTPAGVAPESAQADKRGVEQMLAAIRRLDGAFDRDELDDPHDEQVLAAVKKMAAQADTGAGKGAKAVAAKKSVATSAAKSATKSASKSPARTASKSSSRTSAQRRADLKVVGGKGHQ